MTGRRARHLLEAYASLTLLAWAAGCVILAPLDDVRPTVDKPSTLSDCRDTTCAATRVMSGSVAAVSTRPTPEDMDASAPGCVPQPGAACDPVAQCGCPAGRACVLDDSQLDAGVSSSIACLPPMPGTSKANERCRRTSECAAGLACSTSGVCSRYCASAADCDNRAECLLRRDGQSRIEPGTGACVWFCDPLTPDACGRETECAPASDTSVWLHAVCYGQRGPELPHRAEGQPCERDDDCAHGLSCARFGPPLCTRLCRTDAQCPPARPLCHFTDLRVATGDALGQCAAACDEATLPATEAWSQGPVWTKEQLQACEQQCGGLPRCVEKSCPDSARYAQCMQANRLVLASQRGAPCRSAYVDSVCCTTGERSVLYRMFLNCVDDSSQDAQAQRACVSGL